MIHAKLGFFISGMLFFIPLLCGNSKDLQHKVTPYQAVTVSRILNEGNFVIQAVVGNIQTSSNSWKITTISQDISTTNNFAPHLVTNTLGDALVAWMYLDSEGISQIAASILLHGTSNWITATVSNGTGNAYYYDHTPTINDDGTAFITWTAYQPDINSNIVLCVTANLSKDPAWSTPTIIIPG